MSTFYNLFRDMENSRGVGKRRFQGWVVNNDDSKDNDKSKQQLQRIKVRIHDLHDEIKDEDLPWFSPGNLPAYSGSANVGDHGPVPPNGSKVWVEFEGDTQYHGVYTGAVQAKTNKISEFTNKGKYAKSYPNAAGGVDSSGSLSATDNVRDWKEDTHVSGTSTKVDGRGNVMHVVNGDADRSDNPKAEKQFPKGFNSVIFGNLNLHVSGAVNVSCTGTATVAAGTDAVVSAKSSASVVAGTDVTVTAKGKATVAAQGEAKITSKDKVFISATNKIALSAPSITSTVPIVIGQGADPVDPSEPSKIVSAEAPKPRSRPKLSADGSQKTNQTQDGTMNAEQKAAAELDPTGTKDALASLDDTAKNDVKEQAFAQLMDDPSKDSVTASGKLPSSDSDYSYTARRA